MMACEYSLLLFYFSFVRNFNFKRLSYQNYGEYEIEIKLHQHLICLVESWNNNNTRELWVQTYPPLLCFKY